MNNQITLSSLAMLKVHIDHGKDYLEYLKPFVMQSLFDDRLSIVSDETISKKLSDVFGLVIPHRTVHIVLQRIAKDGFLKKEHSTYTVIKDIPPQNIQHERADAKRKIDAVVHALISFAKENDKEINEEEAINALILFLSNFSISCLKSFLRGTALPNHIESEDWKIVLVSKFISQLINTSPERFEHFILLVQGHMLANALLCPDLQSVSKTYNGVTFYFDTPLLLQYLGIVGEARKQAIDELIILIKKLHGSIACFSHTLDELINVIQNSSTFIDSTDGRGSIVYEARKAKRTKSDLLLLASNAKELLEAGKIIIKPTPPYISKFQIDETIFADALKDEVSYLNSKAKDNDINSVRSIYVLRSGSCPYTVEKSNAVFVTSNTGFATAAYEYGKNIEQSREVSTVITDFSLANTAWLKSPQEAPLLPQKEVMAFAYAALQPSNEFLEKVLFEAEKLEKEGIISAREHQLLRSSQFVQDELMSLTLGEDEDLTERSITRVLEMAQNEIKKEEAAQLASERIAHQKTQEQLLTERNQNERIKEKLESLCKKKSGFFVSIIVFIIYILAIVGFFPGILLNFPSILLSLGYEPPSSIIDQFGSIANIATALLSFLSLWVGFTIKKIRRLLQKKLFDWILKRETRNLGIDPEEFSR